MKRLNDIKKLTENEYLFNTLGVLALLGIWFVFKVAFDSSNEDAAYRLIIFAGTIRALWLIWSR